MRVVMSSRAEAVVPPGERGTADRRPDPGVGGQSPPTLGLGPADGGSDARADLRRFGVVP